MNYKFDDSVKLLKNGEYIILGNTKNGQWIKMTNYIYNIFKIGIDHSLDINELKKCLEDDEDRQFIQNLYENLLDMRIIYDEINNVAFQNKIASLEITNRCNLKCVHCCVDADNLISEKEELSTIELKDAIKKIVEWNPMNIMLSGGEPMVRSDFFEILTYLKSIYKGNIIVSTNGTLINKNNVELLIKNVNNLEISLDGVNEQTCSIVRGKGVFKKVIDSVNLIKSFGFDNITLSMAVGNKNEYLEEEFKDICKNLGVGHMIRRFGSVGRGKENEHLFLDNDKDEAYIPENFLKDNYDGNMGVTSCKAGIYEIFIRHNGDIYPCPSFMSNEYKITNLCDIQQISEIKDKYINKVDVFSILEKINPEIYKNCIDCNVNLFCWTCPGEIEELKDSKASLFNKCSKIKDILYKRVWGTDGVC